MKIILFLTMLFLITAAAAEIEQHEGFPVQAGYELQAPIIIQDIDGDGSLELIAAPENRMVKVFNHTGALNWENTGGRAQYDTGRVPLASDLGGDSRLEIVSYGNPGWSDATYYIWDAAGNKINEFFVGRYLVLSPPAATRERIILTGAAPGRALESITQAAGVHAFDAEGNRLWYLDLGRSVNFYAPIQVGDIDADGIDEAVILTQDINSAQPADGKIWLIKIERDKGTILWSTELGGDARSAAIADTNGDSINEIVAVSSGGTYILDRNGTTLYKFNIKGNPDLPATGDIDGNGVNEVLIASSEENRIYIISNGSLSEFSAGRISSNLALGDLNRDGKLEIAAGNLYGNMYVWDYTGKLLEQRAAARKYHYFTSANISDLERDGNKEIILGNSNGNIYVYTYPGKPRDTAPPATTDNADDEWHNSSVTVTLTASDDNSGVAATYYTVDGREPTKDSARGNAITLSGDGAYTIKYFSVDNAGNVEEVKTANLVKIDKTPPTTIDDSDLQWHNSSVVITLKAADEGSGVKATYYSVDGSDAVEGTTISISGDGIHTIKYYSVDNAGNEEQTHEAVVNIDKTPPVTTDNSDTAWHNSDVTLNLKAQDDLSGVAFIRYAVDGVEQASYSLNVQLTFEEEGIHHIKYYSVDNAGNAEEVKEAVVKIDKTSPFTTDDSDGRWHNRSVTVKFKANDNLAGVSSTYYEVNSGTETLIASFFSWLASAMGVEEADTLQGDNVYLTEEGIFDVQYYSMDNAANTEAKKVSNRVKIDKTSPTIEVSSPSAKTYLHSDIITLSFVSSDTLSGIKNQNAVIDSMREVTSGNTLEMLGLSFGVHEFYISVEDIAGNIESRKVSFDVIATVDSVIALTERGASDGWIASKSISNSLRAKLNSARQKIDAGQNASAKNILEAYINEVEAQSGKAITSEGVSILKAEARYVVEHL